MTPKINGVVETALYVDDLARARGFYETVLGLTPLFSDSRLCAFDVGGRSVLLLFLRGSTLETVVMPGGTIPPHDGAGPIHIGLAISPEDLPSWEERLRAHGIAVEGRATWRQGGTSLYFRDPDGHLLELLTPDSGRSTERDMKKALLRRAPRAAGNGGRLGTAMRRHRPPPARPCPRRPRRCGGPEHP